MERDKVSTDKGFSLAMHSPSIPTPRARSARHAPRLRSRDRARPGRCRPRGLPSLLGAALIFVASACGPTTANGTPTTPDPPGLVESEFALGPGDTFDVRVFGEGEMTGAYRVAPDGTIDFPLIGQVHVAGMLPHDVAHELQEKLRNGFLRNPQVSILVKDQSSKKIIVIGQVAKPGTFSYVSNMSVVEAITVAGGFTPMAAKNDTTITRIDRGQKLSVRVPVADISEGKAGNYYLRPGDIISVPERLF